MRGSVFLSVGCVATKIKVNCAVLTSAFIRTVKKWSLFSIMCGLVFQQQLVKAEIVKVLKLFPVSIASVSYLEVKFSVAAARYGSILVAVSIVTATCLLKVELSS